MQHHWRSELQLSMLPEAPPHRDADARFKLMKTAALPWLLERSVSKGKAHEFIGRSGSATAADVALFLRFQLPPLQFANRDSISRAMRSLLGTSGATSRGILRDLGIMRAPPNSSNAWTWSSMCMA